MTPENNVHLRYQNVFWELKSRIRKTLIKIKYDVKQEFGEIISFFKVHESVHNTRGGKHPMQVL